MATPLEKRGVTAPRNPARSIAQAPGDGTKKRFSKMRLALLLFAMLGFLCGASYTQKDRFTPQMAELSRDLIGDENTARVESWYFYAQDHLDRLKYRIAGDSTSNPFSAKSTELLGLSGPSDESSVVDLLQLGSWVDSRFVREALIPEPVKPAALVLPETKPLRAKLEAGEGVWTTDGLPRSSPDDMLMARTFIRPDTVRPYAVVGVLLLDKRRVRLHITGGTDSPGGDMGVKGPGLIPEAERKNLLAAWNGGFQGPHGGFGMYADGKRYRALRNGLASVVVAKDGRMSIGEWGRDLFWNDDMAAVRQNAVLLVDNCQVSKRTSEGNNTWGYVEVNSAEFITWRSAIGLTANGDLLVAAGNSLSAQSLANALWSAGACYAMQLDINSPYVLTSLFFPQQDGSMKPAKFMDSMPSGPSRFFSTQAKDFMYVTLDETNYKP